MVAATSSEGFLIVAVVVVVVVVIIIIIIATIIMVSRSSFSDSVRPLYFVHVFKKTCYRQHCAQRKSAGISFTQRPILRFFAPQERHVAPMGVKLAWRRGRKVPSSLPNFTPIGATTRV